MKKKKTGRRVLSFLLTLAMVVGLMPGMVMTAYAAEATALTAEMTTWKNGDYVVPAGGLTIASHITVNGIVNLTLTKGATLTANTGITLGDNAKLNVSGEGEMVVNGSNGNANSTIAGTGKLVLKSGTLTATGGNGQSFSSGTEQTGNTGGVAINGTVIVNSGTLAATGGNGGSLNAGTISQLNGGTGGAAIGGAVTINGGTVTATGGNGGSITITNYGDTNKGGNGGAAIGGAVTIKGGKLTATKGDNGSLNIKNGSPNYAGTGSAGYAGTLTLGANVKLYEGTDNTGTVLDDNDSDSRVYSGDKKANMYAYGPNFTPETDKNALNNAITAAEIMYVGIKNNTDNTDVASALKTAIDIAKKVADNDKADQDAVDAATADITTAITAAEASLPMTNAETTWKEGTYFVPMYGATIADHITVKGTVNLILAKGATFTANAGVTLSDGATLNVIGNGTMVVNGTSGNTNSTVAGSGVLVLKSGTLTVNGGNGGNIAADQMNVTANAGGAAINGNVIVNGGTLTATGGNGGSIGDYAISCTSGAGGVAVNGNVTVNSGTLTVADGARGTGGRTYRCTFGVGGTGYSGTLTLGKNIKLYEGTEASDEKLLDGDDSSSRVYEGAKKSKMYAQGPDKSALNDVIITAQILYFGIEENTDYTNIASTLKTAIDNAKAVADKDEADQDAVDAAITALDKAQKEANDTKVVVDEIKALPESTALTTENYDTYKDAINKADTDFNELSTVAQGNIPEALKSKLTALKEAIEKEETDTAAAKAVSDKIAALPAKEAVTKDNKEAIEAAKAAYDALTDDQKKKVSEEDKQKLNDAVATIEAIERDEADTAEAKKAADAINALPASDKVTTGDKAAIEAARKAYNDLTEDQQKKVSADTLKKLENAEKALETLVVADKAAKELAAAKQAAQAAMNSEVKVTVKGKKIKVQWTKATSADGYEVYVQYCGKKITKPVKTIKKNSTTKATIKKINGKKLNLKKQFRVYVVAYKMIDGKKVTLAKSNTGHVVGTKNKKYTNVKSIKLKKKAYTIAVGKTVKVKAKIKLVDKNKKHIPKSHGAKFRYRTSDSSIATVSKSGKIKGIKKGTCTIYVYAINGKMKKVKVTVK